GTLTFTCSGLGSGNAQHVYVELNGSPNASFVTPSIAMASPAFTLTYTPCVPNSGTCNGTTSVWQNTVATAFKVTSGVNGLNSIPQFSIFIGKQDAYVGTIAQYTGNLYFSFVCGEGGSQAPC
ncbi:MAG TPA: hypothetical protein VFL13_10640, partial [Candidatus Baltobacteraceae bacterium]|nr:hypothetical protein [Candidatus Baltobacteraceae bacterium]